jgi:hypothetical protein
MARSRSSVRKNNIEGGPGPVCKWHFSDRELQDTIDTIERGDELALYREIRDARIRAARGNGPDENEKED